MTADVRFNELEGPAHDVYEHLMDRFGLVHKAAEEGVMAQARKWVTGAGAKLS